MEMRYRRWMALAASMLLIMNGIPCAAEELTGEEQAEVLLTGEEEEGLEEFLTSEESAAESSEEVTGADKVIIGFEALSSAQSRLIFSSEEKPSLEELMKKMPEQLFVTVSVDGEKEMDRLQVAWQCVGSYEESSLYYYVFLPEWDESEYRLGEGLDLYTDVPSIEIHLIPAARGETGELPMAAAASNEKVIFDFLLSEMGLNSAGACGVLANLYCESGFRADIVEYGYTWETGGGYGLCQWTNFPRTNPQGRRTDLVNYCRDHGYDYKTLEGQLHYLYYELNLPGYKTVLLDYLRAVPNTAEGAYLAGYRWCYYFEEPYNYKQVSITRGNLAMNEYWPRWKTGSVSALPEGIVDVMSSTEPKKIYVRGWAFDRDALTQALTIRVCIGGTDGGNGVEMHQITADRKREDVESEYPGVGANHGFDAVIDTAKTGRQSVYIYAVNAGAGSGNKLIGSGILTISPDTQTPAMAGVFNSKYGGDIRWTKVAGASGYRVYCRRSGEGTRLVAEITDPDTLQCYDTKIKDGCWGRVYYYSVKAVINGKTGPESEAAVLQRIAPAVITGKSSPKMGCINVKWECSVPENKAFGYEIQYALTRADLYAQKGSFRKVVVNGRNNCLTTLTGLSSGRSWHFRVRCYVTYKHSVTGKVTKTWSQYSAATSITVK